MTEDIDYVYHKSTSPPIGGTLPAGEYDFTVAEVGDLYRKKETNTLVLPVKIYVGPHKVKVLDWRTAGKNKKGDDYNNINAFLEAINRAPGDGERANLSRIYLEGATGRVMLKVEQAKGGTLDGIDVNRVNFYIVNRQPGAALVPAAHGQVDPDNIPF